MVFLIIHSSAIYDRYAQFREYLPVIRIIRYSENVMQVKGFAWHSIEVNEFDEGELYKMLIDESLCMVLWGIDGYC